MPCRVHVVLKPRASCRANRPRDFLTSIVGGSLSICRCCLLVDKARLPSRERQRHMLECKEQPASAAARVRTNERSATGGPEADRMFLLPSITGRRRRRQRSTSAAWARQAMSHRAGSVALRLRVRERGTPQREESIIISLVEASRDEREG